MDDPEVREELEATVAARRELGPEHDRELIEGFLERIDKAIDRRVEDRVAERRDDQHQHGLPLPPLPAQLGPMIPIVVVAGIFGGHTGVAIALAVVALIVIVNVLRR